MTPRVCKSCEAWEPEGERATAPWGKCRRIVQRTRPGSTCQLHSFDWKWLRRKKEKEE